MANEFEFLESAQAKGVYTLLQRLTMPELATVLAGLSWKKSLAVLAFFDPEEQKILTPAINDAKRKGTPQEAQEVADKLRAILERMKQAAGDQPPRQMPPAAAQPAPQPMAPPPVQPQYPPRPAAPAASSGLWRPREATAAPINGPAVPGKPMSPAGDPRTSPLAKTLLGSMLGIGVPAPQKNPHPADVPPAVLPVRPAQTQPRPRPLGAGSPAEPPPEGVVRRVRVGSQPRVIGPRGQQPQRPMPPPEPINADSKARPMDGKGILAAILRESSPEVRDHVRHDDPRLFGELSRRMFHFDDLGKTESRALAQVFTTAPAGPAALALAFADPALRKRALAALPLGRRRLLEDEAARAPGSLDAVEKAQQTVLEVALQLQAAGRILIDPHDPDLAGGAQKGIKL